MLQKVMIGNCFLWGMLYSSLQKSLSGGNAQANLPRVLLGLGIVVGLFISEVVQYPQIDR